MNKSIFVTTILYILIALTSCNSGDPGSGGGIGGTGITPVVATGATSGSITGFGSVIVNGVRFDTDNSTFFLNDQSISQGELRVGMNVLAAVDFSAKVASQINYVPSLIGPVESVNLAEKTFISFGQIIQLSDGTTFENLSLAEVSPGMVLEVSGFRNASGTILASFVRVAADATRYQLAGAILSELGNTQVFSLNGLLVNIEQADLSQISVSELEFGDKVYVTANSVDYDSAASLLTVDTLRPALEPMVNVGERVEYEGIVSTFISPFEFTVYWQPVVATEQTRVEFQDGTLADLSMILLNTRLEIEGVTQEDGSYLASKIILIATENAKITGVVEGVTPELKTFSLLGLEIQTTDMTRYDGSTDDDANQDVTSYADISVGQYVEVDAEFLGNRLVAIDVEVDDIDDRVILEGPVTALQSSLEILDIMNQPIMLGPDTSFENSDNVEISKQAFMERLQVGIVIKARWDEFSSVALPPDSLEIE